MLQILDSILNPEGPLAGATIMVVLAHPDDEALACGGTLARAGAAGARVVLVCASRGELGPVSDPGLAPDGDLGRVRALELGAAARTLGIAEVLLLDHPDGSLRWVDALTEEIIELLELHRPAAVITFDRDGLYWHADHIGVHERTTEAVAQLGSRAPPLYYVQIPVGVMRAVAERARARGGAPPDTGFWGISPDAFGVAVPPASFRVDVREWAHLKLAALRCHRTQAGLRSPFHWIDENDARRWLGYELFRRAPADPAGLDVLEPWGEGVAEV